MTDDTHAAPAPSDAHDAVVLGVFRAVFGVVVVLSLADLLPDLFVHFSDEGWMPRWSYLESHARPQRFSLMDAFGRPWHVAVYAVLLVLAALCLAVGYRTRLASVATFFLVCGLHERNTYPFDGSDNVVRVMLFWLMFSDAGAAVSVDASLRGDASVPPPRPVPLALLRSQAAFVYLAATLFKLQGEHWMDGTAARHGLVIAHTFGRAWSTPLGDVAWFVKACTYGTIVGEGLLGLALLAPARWVPVKRFGVLLGFAFHLSTIVLMNVGNFPMVMASTYLLHLPATDLARLRAFVERRLVAPAAARARALALPTAHEAWVPFRVPTRVLAARDGALGLLFGLMVWNGLPKNELPYVPATPAWVTYVVQTFEVWQQWDMFAPRPIENDYYVTAEGTLGSGRHVDPLEEAPGGPIARHEQHFPYRRWTKAMNSIAWGERSILLPFGRYVCRKWNPRGQGPDALVRFQLVRHEQPVGPIGQPRPPETSTTIWEHRCFD